MRPKKHPKTGVYYLRKPVPPGLRDVIGKWELKESLRTKDPVEAKQRAPAVLARFEAIIASARATGRVLTDREVSAVCGEWYRREIAKWSEDYGRASDWEWAETLLEERWHEDETGDRDLLAATEDRDDARAVLQSLGYPVDAATVSRVARHLIGAKLMLARAMQRRANGDLAPGEEAKFPPLSGPSSPDLAESPPASALFERHLERRAAQNGTQPHTIAQERGTLQRFIEVVGDRPASAYGRGDVTRFLDALRRLPNTYGRSPKDKGKTVADLIARADATNAKRLIDKTVKRHSTALSQFFRFAMDEGHISNNQRVELVEGHRFREERSARSQRDAWTSEELTALFQSPVWKGRDQRHVTKPGPHIIRDAKFWLPILALFHGARLEEFADLYRRDVGCDGGVWFFSIAETEGNEATGTRRRTLKTDNATRNVPIHPELLRLGFLAYVERTAQSAGDPLFPDLKPQGLDQRRGARFTRDFRYYREAVGVYRPGVGMHAFRHTANTRLRDVITDWQQERHVAYLLGHSQGGGEGRDRYDKGPGLKAVAATLALLQFPEVDLSHLHVAAPPRPD